MKKQILFFSAVVLMAFSTSCNKDNDPPTPNPNPNPNPTNPTASTPNPTTPVINGVSGTLVSVIMKYSYTSEYVSTPITMEYDVAVAAFPAATGSDLISAGTVTVNTHELEKADNNAYYVMGIPGMTPANLSFSSGSSDWNVGGSGSITGFSYSDVAGFPEFEGSVPSSVSKSDGVTIDLSGNVSNADSVYLVIAAGNAFVQTAVGGNATSISLSAAEMQSLPAVSDNSAILQVVPFRITLETISGKQYAFIKESAIVSSININ